MVGHSQVYHSIVNAALSLISSMPFRAKRGTLRHIHIRAITSILLKEVCKDIQHALSCKQRDFVSLRHIHIRTITSILLKEVFKDVRVEPQLHQLTGEYLQHSTVAGNELRLDISARGFW